MADVRSPLEQARWLHSAERWGEACDVFLAVDDVEPLNARDLELFAESAQVMGRGELAVATLRRAYDARVGSGDVDRALAIGFWLWQALVINGEFSRAGGWAALMRGLISQEPEGSSAAQSETRRATKHSGWLLITEAYGLIAAGRYEEAVDVLETAAGLGASQAETDLKAFATTMWGRALVKGGRLGEGLTHLDEAMLAIVDRDTTPRATSMLYCGAIATCLEAHEWRRAREWTLALGAWLDDLPRQTGAYFGNCRVYRALLWRRCGDWPHALHELDDVCAELREGFGQRIAAHAYYELGELHRLLGDPLVEQDYRRARDRGAEDQPGLALLRLSQGETASAVAGIRRALVEATDPLARLGLLPACVQIMVGAGHLQEAESAAEEIASLVRTYDTPVARAELAQAKGAVALAGGEVDSALILLRDAARTWREIEAPYELASVAVLIAQVCRALHDDEAADAELESARATFARLGAQPDVRRVEALQRRQGEASIRSGRTAHTLTRRELEVLALVADGASNHEIAGRLFLSDRTVHRHVSNILEKLGVHSRTAAAAVAIRDRLLGP